MDKKKFLMPVIKSIVSKMTSSNDKITTCYKNKEFTTGNMDNSDY